MNVSDNQLPSPDQIRALHQAQAANLQALRMADAANATLTGIVAIAIYIGGIGLTIIHANPFHDIAPFVLCVLTWGFIFVATLLIKKMRQRSTSAVIAQTRDEAAAVLDPPSKSWTIVLLAGFVIVFGGMSAAVASLMPRMSDGFILAALAFAPLFGTAYFVIRFIRFQFWEDLLFIACIALAYVPFFLLMRERWEPTVVSFLSIPIALFVTRCLHRRWTNWLAQIDRAEAGE